MNLLNFPIIFLCLMAPFLFLGVVLIAASQRMRQKAVLTRGWPVASGVITETAIEEGATQSEEGPKIIHNPRLRYTYRVAGVEYQGSQVAFGLLQSGSRGTAERSLAAYPPGKPVEVYYNPDTPAEAVLGLARADTSTLFLTLGIILTIIGAMIACVAATISLVAVSAAGR